jgi:hypothetical protein
VVAYSVADEGVDVADYGNIPTGENLPYNSAAVTLRVYPYSLYLTGKQVKELGLEIAAAFGRIGNAWDALHLGWAGQSQATAEHFSHQYMRARPRRTAGRSGC